MINARLSERLGVSDMQSISDFLEGYAKGSSNIKNSTPEQNFLTREIVRLFRKWLKNNDWEGTLSPKSSRLAIYLSVYKKHPQHL